ncbi:MAG: adenylyltransferase/cytidyltransferase family protein [SAR202 cluster bacterium]|nr:adenylyltransferase/cytidyltransferase family protein [SAR202 cluster bacterium]|tara:strand:- start:552 stop:959 length:408 start_codon:yes stop_codon:yes gene_type:complete
MKIGFTCSSFDLLHAGHILMLKECSNNCDYLVVGLQTDPTIDRENKNKPVQNVFERYIQLDAIDCVDEIAIYETEDQLLQLINYINPDIRFIGEDWRDKRFTGWRQAKLKHYEMFYNKRYGYSTSELRKRVNGSN